MVLQYLHAIAGLVLDVGDHGSFHFGHAGEQLRIFWMDSTLYTMPRTSTCTTIYQINFAHLQLFLRIGCNTIWMTTGDSQTGLPFLLNKSPKCGPIGWSSAFRKNWRVTAPQAQLDTSLGACTRWRSGDQLVPLFPIVVIDSVLIVLFPSTIATTSRASTHRQFSVQSSIE